MVQQQDRSRPYAAPANMVAVISRVRTRNVPETINNDFLRIAGVPDAVFGRVMQALRFLGLVHEDGRPTDTLRAISGAPDAQYRELLAGAVRQAYQEDFQNVDPGQDSQARILDAFRPYQPRSQTGRMVILFLGLCREAGIPILDAPRDRRMREGRPRVAALPPARRARAQAPNFSPHSPPGSGTNAGGILFGVTEEDIGLLQEEEFNEVWGALGKLARARARARSAERERQTPEPNGAVPEEAE